MTTVVALGGNALVRAGERGTAAELRENLRRACEALRPLLAERELVVTHGNGPQVGAALLRHERAAEEVPPLPLSLAVAETQAQIGALLTTELAAVAARAAACVLTHVRVETDDPAFAEPTKPIGPFYGGDEARELERARGWRLVEDAGRGWRRVVPSPSPQAVVELEPIRTLVAAETLVVACGGGGIPVVAREGRLDGIDAVIDKDLASGLLARELGAQRLLVLTDVPALYRDYRGSSEREVRDVSPDEAEAMLGDLTAGSMRPKVSACIDFVRATGGEALITSVETLARALAGESGTRVVG